MLLLYMENNIMYLMHISLYDIKCLRSQWNSMLKEQYGKIFPTLEVKKSVIQYIFDSDSQRLLFSQNAGLKCPH